MSQTLNSALRVVDRVLGDGDFDSVMTSGVVSRIWSRPGVKTSYFTITMDDDANELNCVIPIHKLRAALEDGERVVVIGRLRIYEKQSRFHLEVHSLRHADPLITAAEEGTS